MQTRLLMGFGLIVACAIVILAIRGCGPSEPHSVLQRTRSDAEDARTITAVTSPAAAETSVTESRQTVEAASQHASATTRLVARLEGVPVTSSLYPLEPAGANPVTVNGLGQVHEVPARSRQVDLLVVSAGAIATRVEATAPLRQPEHSLDLEPSIPLKLIVRGFDTDLPPGITLRAVIRPHLDHMDALVGNALRLATSMSPRIEAPVTTIPRFGQYGGAAFLMAFDDKQTPLAQGHPVEFRPESIVLELEIPEEIAGVEYGDLKLTLDFQTELPVGEFTVEPRRDGHDKVHSRRIVRVPRETTVSVEIPSLPYGVYSLMLVPRRGHSLLLSSEVVVRARTSELRLDVDANTSLSVGAYAAKRLESEVSVYLFDHFGTQLAHGSIDPRTEKHVSFDGITAGRYLVRASADRSALMSDRRPVTVSSGQSVRIDVELKPTGEVHILREDEGSVLLLIEDESGVSFYRRVASSKFRLPIGRYEMGAVGGSSVEVLVADGRTVEVKLP